MVYVIYALSYHIGQCNDEINFITGVAWDSLGPFYAIRHVMNVVTKYAIALIALSNV